MNRASRCEDTVGRNLAFDASCGGLTLLAACLRNWRTATSSHEVQTLLLEDPYVRI